MAQNPAAIMAPKYLYDDGVNVSILDLPTIGGGYSGQQATSSQNIILDNQGEIVFFIVDENIYDRTGALIDVFWDNNSSPDNPEIDGFVSEVAVVPIPGECGCFYLLSSRGASGVEMAHPMWGKLCVTYDQNGILDPNSGLETDPNDPATTAFEVEALIDAAVYQTSNNVHDERPLIAVTPLRPDDSYFFYLANSHKLFRLRITNAGIAYEYFLDMDNIDPSVDIPNSINDRQEMEVVQLANGDYRLGVPIQWIDPTTIPNGNFTGVYIFDMDGTTGDLIPGTGRTVAYQDFTPPLGTSEKVYVQGIEFSPDGSKMYVTHGPAPSYTGTLDIWDVTNPAGPTIISTNPAYESSHIESWTASDLILPGITNIGQVTNSNNPTFPADFNQALNSGQTYNVTSPYGAFSSFKENLRLLQDNIDGMDYRNIVLNPDGENYYLDVPCAGDDLILNPTLHPDNVYTWYDESGAIIVGQSPITVNPVTDTYYVLLCVNPFNCEARDTFFVDVLDGGYIPYEIRDEACEDDGSFFGYVLLNENGFGLLSGGTYDWYDCTPGGPYLPSSTNNFYTFTNNGIAPGSYSICVDFTPTSPTACPVSHQFDFTIHPTPDLTAISNMSFCTGGGPYPLPVLSPFEPVSWSGPGIIPPQTFGGTYQFNPTTPGTYTLEACFTNTGCCSSIDVVVTEPPIAFGPITPESCPGACDGTFTAFSAGNGTYDWTLTPGNQTATGTSANFTDLCSGSYTITYTDANGCTGSETFFITSLPPLNVTANYVGSWTVCQDPNDLISFSVSGAPSGATITWSNGATGTTVTVPGGNYTPGWHQMCVTVSTANGACTDTECLWFYVRPAPVVNMPVTDFCASTPYGWIWTDNDGSWTTTNGSVVGGIPFFGGFLWAFIPDYNDPGTHDLTFCANGFFGCCATTQVNISNMQATTTATSSCQGSSTGMASITVVDGIPPYSYAWSSGGTAATETGLAPGTYTVTVTDAIGCTLTETVIIDATPVPPVTFIIVDETCGGSNDGSVTADVASWPNATYVWNTGATGPILNNVGAGTYTVTVTDVSGCVSTGTAIVQGPIAITASIVCTPTCDDEGTSTVTIAGGTPPYTYTWSNGQTTTNTMSNTDDIAGLVPGTYSVTVTDANGCEVTEACDVLLDPFVVDAGQDITFCYNDFPFSTTLGSTTTGSVNCSWTIVSQNPGQPVLSNPNDCNPTLTLDNSLYPYFVNGCLVLQLTAVNDEGCVATDDITICMDDRPGGVFDITPASCDLCNGSVTFVPDAQTTPGWDILWSNGDTGPTATGLCPGAFTGTMTTAAGCVTPFSVIIPDAGTVSLSATSTDVTCHGSCDGTIDLTITGGTAPYTIDWSNGSSSEDLLGLCPGTYIVEVYDANNCEATIAVDIVEPNPLQVTFTTSYDCSLAPCGGIATANVTGGTPPYLYYWGGAPSSNATETGICADLIAMTVEDANGCIVQGNFTMPQPPALDLGPDITNCLSQNGAAILVLGQQFPNTNYTYQWTANPASAISQLSDPTIAQPQYTVIPGAVEFTLTITDPSTGCVVSDDIVINYSQIQLALDVHGCLNDCSIDITAIPTGGTPPYTYQWGPSNNNVTTATSSGNCQAVWDVTVTDALGCTATLTGGTGVLTPNLNAISDDYNLCLVLGETAQLDLFPPPFGMNNITWSPAGSLSNPNINNPVASPTVTTTYTVTGSSTQGGFGGAVCTYTDQITIVVDPNPGCTYAQGPDVNEHNVDELGTVSTGDELLEELGYKVYPNPNNGSFTAEFLNGNGFIVLTDLRGRIIYEDTAEKQRFFVDAQELPSGVYLLQLWQNGKVQTAKVIIQ